MKVPQHYIPSSLNGRQKTTVKRELKKSKRAYAKKMGKEKYYTRKKIKGYKNRRSPWENRVKAVYQIPRSKKLTISALTKKSKCTKKALKQIVRKGMGAYYSSGSRPNQTPQSWGYARLYSSLAGGPASKVDYCILKKGCKRNSKSLKLAKNPKTNATRKKVQLTGGGSGGSMKEKIIRFEPSPIKFKKYRAFISNNGGNKKTKTKAKTKTKTKERHIDFGDNRYPQFKDRTPLGLYTSKNHNDIKRMRRYYSRHSGIPNRLQSIELEKKKSGGLYNAKILSHTYLW